MSYIVAIDQSTSGTKVALWDEQLRMVRMERRKHRQFYPAPGYAEHDAEEIWNNTAALLCSVTSEIDPQQIAGIGIANQRETTVFGSAQRVSQSARQSSGRMYAQGLWRSGCETVRK